MSQEPQQILQPNSNGRTQSLLGTLVDFYKSCRSPSQQKISHIESKITENNKKIVKVVQHRKDLQNTYNTLLLNQQFSNKMEQFYKKVSKYEEIISILSQKLHQRQNYVLDLQIEVNQYRSRSSQRKKLQNADNKMYAKINQGIRDMKTLVNGFVQQISTLTTQQQELQNNQNVTSNANNSSVQKIQRQIKDSIRSKQMLVQNKTKFIKLKEQMLQISENMNNKYIQSLKQGLSTYEKLFISRKLQEDIQPHSGSASSSTSQNQAYAVLKHQSLQNYQSTILKLKKQNESLQARLDESENICKTASDQRQGLQQQLNATIMGLRIKLANSVQQVKNKQQIIQQLQKSAQQGQKDSSKVIQELRDTSHKLKEAQRKAQLRQKEIKKQYSVLKGKNDQLIQQVKQLKQEKAKITKKLQQEIKQQNNKIQKLQQSIRYLQGKFQSTQRQLQLQRSQKKIHQKQQNQSLKKEIQKSKQNQQRVKQNQQKFRQNQQKLKQNQQKMQSQIQKNRLQIQRLSNQMRDVQIKLQNQVDINRRLQSQIQNLLQENESMQQKLNQSQINYEKLLVFIQQQKIESENMKQKLRQYEQVRKQSIQCNWDFVKDAVQNELAKDWEKLDKQMFDISEEIRRMLNIQQLK